ncbi:hypothetical protein [Acinetobacter baylyi]|uniref:hypothetical protein n=1 Tax=Acinetobacter baylyi TaxID=202950 RepID=UPI000EA0B8E3|nr:hypothetical protein [Acinetobacter baylyi]
MSDTQQRKEQSYLLLNIVLIILETVFSFILKNDGVIGLQAKQFVQNKTSIRINSYLPYFDFYIQFCEKGILFDYKAPEHAVDLTVNTTFLDLFKILSVGNRRSIKKMRIEGDPDLKEQFKDLMLHFSAPKLFADWKQWLAKPETPEEAVASKRRIAPLLEKIDQQRSQINYLTLEVKQYQNRIRRIERRQRLINIAFSVTSIVLILLLVYTMFRLYG